VAPCAQRRKVWLAPTAQVPCSNAANRSRAQDLEHAKWILHLTKFRYGATAVINVFSSLPAQETAKHHAKFGWLPLSDVAAVTKPRRESRWNLPGYLKPANRSQPLVGRSSPYCGDMWRRYCCLISFPILSIRALVAKIQLDKLCDGAQMAIFFVIFASCIFSEPHAGHIRYAF